MLDQTLLPEREETLVCPAWPQVVEAIRRLSIRGAPAIGVAGAMGVALAAARADASDLPALRAEIGRAAAALRSARPTAVNLAWAVDRMCALADAHPGPGDALAAALADAARAVHDDEVARCQRHRGARPPADGARRADHDHLQRRGARHRRLRHRARGGPRRRTPPTPRCA